MSKKVEDREGVPVEGPKNEEAEKVEEPKSVVEKKKPVRAEKPKNEDKRKEGKGARGLYKVDGEKVTRLRPTCERCGIGYFMADHHDRYTCGHCGFTRYKQSEP